MVSAASQPPRKLLDKMRRLLMGGLSTWWDVASAAWLRAGRAITNRKNIGIASGLKSLGDDELAYPVGLETVQTTENVGALHSGRKE